MADTLAQIKTAYKAVTDIYHATFAIRDYLLYRIYENTYNGGNPVSTSILTSRITSDGTVAGLEQEVNNALANGIFHVKDIKYSHDENGQPIAWIIYYV